MEATLTHMTAAIAEILGDSPVSVYLYGSAAMDDYRPGWSDIDLLALAHSPITSPQASRLLTLRQDLPLHYPDALYARNCEGAVMPLDFFTKEHPCNTVYWGTSGQRITTEHTPDCFCLWQLHHSGRLLHGPDVRDVLPEPTTHDLLSATARHLRTILDHGRGGRSLYAFGWLLDIARGLYTVQHNEITAKTAAGEWALSQGLCPDEAALQLALTVRRDPALIREETVLRQAEGLTAAIAGFAEVLQRALTRRHIPIPD